MLSVKCSCHCGMKYTFERRKSYRDKDVRVIDSYASLCTILQPSMITHTLQDIFMCI